MAKKDVQVNIRMTTELKEYLLESASLSNRSLNSEIIELLSNALIAKGIIKSKPVNFSDYTAGQNKDEMYQLFMNMMVSSFVENNKDKFKKVIDEVAEKYVDDKNKKPR
ncbi:Arc family DNA-binding protein [Serratia sp. CY76391]|uniref:Arc family DNA-binding protein n=1 Tax=Serratia sp. CY76391 TaxID=3383681 RepID=UPI003FA17877